MDETRYQLVITPELAGDRLDKALTALLQDSAELSRARVQALLKAGQVSSAGKAVTDGAQAVVAGTAYELVVPPAVKPDHLPAQDIPVDIVHEDKDVIVINKPAGLVVHPAAGNRDGTLVNALLWHRSDELSGIGGEQRPGIVHRLDKETTGLMVVAKHDKAHQKLSVQFSDHSLSRTYYALVWGVPMPRAGTVEAPVGRHPRDRKKMAVVSSGKPAVTHYEVMQVLAAGALSLLRCQLETGRTHQIRVHLAHLGHALVGDPVYGAASASRKAARLDASYQSAVRSFTRQALHAGELEFIHPRTGRRVHYAADMPADMTELIGQLQATKSTRKA